MGYKPKWYDNEQWLLFEYIKNGRSISEIARKAGVTDETIRKLLLKYKIKGSR